jgi:hypothetical protein
MPSKLLTSLFAAPQNASIHFLLHDGEEMLPRPCLGLLAGVADQCPHDSGRAHCSADAVPCILPETAEDHIILFRKGEGVKEEGWFCRSLLYLCHRQDSNLLGWDFLGGNKL